MQSHPLSAFRTSHSTFFLLAALTFPIPAAPPAPPATASTPATKPIAMKPISPAEEATYAQALDGRAKLALDDLKLSDPAKADHVRQTIIAQYRTLRAWHDTYDDELKSLNKNAAQNAPQIAAIKSTLTTLHTAFLEKLAQDLTPDQIEIVKDRMTYGTVKVTYDEYLKENPTLTPDQKSQILTTLKEARELAMDDGSQSEKAATFKKYKGKINNLLSAWKKAATTP